MLKKCKELWPQHKLVLVCRKGTGDFLLKTGVVDEVFEVQKGDAASYSRVLESLKNQQVDTLIAPHESLRTAFFCRQIKAKTKITFKKYWSFLFFNHTVVKPKGLPDSLRQISLLSKHDDKLAEALINYTLHEKPYQPDANNHLSAPPAWASMSVREQVLARPQMYQALKEKFNLQGFENKNAILIFPGSVWATKRWTEEGFIGAGKALKEQGYDVYIMGGPGEEELSERVAAGIPGVISLAGKTKIIESAQLIARAALVIGNDSASTHLAAACETPLIAVFGPTVLPFGYRPWSAETYVVQLEGLECRPCGKHGHKVCPIGTHVCMKNIPAKDVLLTAKTILQNSGLSR